MMMMKLLPQGMLLLRPKKFQHNNVAMMTTIVF
jgi:hypothetical protein